MSHRTCTSQATRPSAGDLTAEAVARFHALELLLEGIAALALASLADERGPHLVPAQVADIRHLIGRRHRLHEAHTVAVRAGESVALARAGARSADDRI